MLYIQIAIEGLCQSEVEYITVSIPDGLNILQHSEGPCNYTILSGNGSIEDYKQILLSAM